MLPITKTVDNKGRLALGQRFSNHPVSVEHVSEYEIVVKLVRVIPEEEAWLYDNTDALASVRRGLNQARAGELSDGPDLETTTED